MLIYLPIAEIPVNIFLLLALGGMAGILAGMFGIGGGFLMTPLLIFIGIPPAVAVSTSANQIVAASVSGFLAHWHKRNVDIKMGIFLLIGGWIGSSAGVWLFAILKKLGQLDLVISLAYVVFLGSVGAMMALESRRALRRAKEGIVPVMPRLPRSLRRLPWQIYFPHSDLTISAWLPIAVGVGTGILVSLMGIGGGFILMPAMIYLLGMPTSVVVGTSLFQTIFTTANVTLLQAIGTQTVDIVLAMLLLTGSVIGAQIGTKLGMRIAPEKLRLFLALLVLTVCFRIALGLVLSPGDLFSVERVAL